MRKVDFVVAMFESVAKSQGLIEFVWFFLTFQVIFEVSNVKTASKPRLIFFRVFLLAKNERFESLVEQTVGFNLKE
jgi:hypothetical protein